MTSLNRIQGKWLKEFRKLQKRHRRQIAAPFLSVKPRHYDPTKIPSILYVGKATQGRWFLEKFRKSVSVNEWSKRTRECMDESVKTNSGFLRFARRLSAATSKRVGHQGEPLSNLIWTNLCKIGTLSGNPDRSLRDAQHDLAIETLRREIRTYKPKLIVFATGDYGAGGGDLLDGLVGTAKNSWDSKQEKKGYWWRPAKGEMPALLWIYHPERKPERELRVWLQKACALLLTHYHISR
jgi:hypothetical protein